MTTEYPIQVFNFPTGETHVKAPSGYFHLINKNILYIPFEQNQNLNDWLMAILLATNVFHRRGVKLDLYIPYLPYSRQDRPTSQEEPFSLKVIGGILNLQNYRRVYTLDVHSDVAYGCVNNLVNIEIDTILKKSAAKFYPTLVIPDQGAYKRLSKISANFENTVTTIKHRDTNTGALEIRHLIGDVDGQDCLIVDDICDGGGTFVLLAKKLYSLGAKSVHLFVTHGIFSKGLNVLWDAGINSIHTTNSCRSNLCSEGKLEVIDVREIINHV